VEIRPFQEPDTDVVVALWDRCGLLRPWNDPYKDIARKLTVQRDLFLVGVHDGRVVGVVMAGYEGHRGWINYLAVEPEHRRRGFGRALMDEAEQRLRALGCPKAALQVRRDNTEIATFYRGLGYTEDNVISMGKRFEIDDAG